MSVFTELMVIFLCAVKTDDEGLAVLGTVSNHINTKLDKLGKLQEEMSNTQCLKVWSKNRVRIDSTVARLKADCREQCSFS